MNQIEAFRRWHSDFTATLAAMTTGAGLRLRRVQTGRVQNYALGIALGLIAMALGYLLIAVR